MSGGIRTLCHVAIRQSDIDARGSQRVIEEAIERLRKAYSEELARHHFKAARVIRVDMTVAEEG